MGVKVEWIGAYPRVKGVNSVPVPEKNGGGRNNIVKGEEEDRVEDGKTFSFGGVSHDLRAGRVTKASTRQGN